MDGAALEPDDAELTALLVASRSIAVLGYKPGPDEAAHRIPEYLYRAGYRVIAVNPLVAGSPIFGETAVARLGELTWAVDLVDVFRAPRHLPAHVEEILALEPSPKLVFFQLGVRHAQAAARLRAAGIAVIEDRCLMVEHRRLLAT